MDFFIIYYLAILYIYISLLMFNSNRQLYFYFKTHNLVKQILSSDIYNKYFKNINLIYKGSKLYHINPIFHFAYVSFVSGTKYIDLINGTLFSVHFFSIYPILLYVSGNITEEMKRIFELYDRLLVFSIPSEMNNIYFMKLRVSLLAPVLVGQIVESDTIVLPGADCLFARIEKEISYNYPYPMMTRHHDIRSPIKGNGTINILKYPMNKRSMRYMHAHMSWTYHSLPFIAKIYRDSFILHYKDDEYALNLNLWESKAYKQWCIYDPIYSVVDISNSDNIFKQYFNVIIFFNFIHGCKLRNIQQNILLKLKKVKYNNYKMVYYYNKSIKYTTSCIINKEIISHIDMEKCLI